MDRDDRGEARFAVMHQFDQFVLVEVRLGPECHRARLFNPLILAAEMAGKWGE